MFSNTACPGADDSYSVEPPHGSDYDVGLSFSALHFVDREVVHISMLKQMNLFAFLI